MKNFITSYLRTMNSKQKSFINLLICRLFLNSSVMIIWSDSIFKTLSGAMVSYYFIWKLEIQDPTESRIFRTNDSKHRYRVELFLLFESGRFLFAIFYISTNTLTCIILILFMIQTKVIYGNKGILTDGRCFFGQRMKPFMKP